MLYVHPLGLITFDKHLILVIVIKKNKLYFQSLHLRELLVADDKMYSSEQMYYEKCENKKVSFFNICIVKNGYKRKI